MLQNLRSADENMAALGSSLRYLLSSGIVTTENLISQTGRSYIYIYAWEEDVQSNDLKDMQICQRGKKLELLIRGGWLFSRLWWLFLNFEPSN